MTHTVKNRKKLQCLDCGNNQTNHLLSWITNTFSIITQPLDKILVSNFLGKQVYGVLSWCIKPYLFILKALHLIKWNTDQEKALTARSRVIWEEAPLQHIHMEQLVILGKPVEFYRATLPTKKEIFFESIPPTTNQFITSYAWMDDKYILKKKLRKNNIPTPQGYSVFTWEQAKKVWSRIEHPVIVKPRLGSRGRHTTTYIYTQADLKKAYIAAKKLCFFVMIEEHLIGSVYRGTCINGKLVGVLEGMPPRISGNRKDTIELLISKKNENSTSSVIKPIAITPILVEFLSRNGYSLDTILEHQKTIDLSEKIGISYGGGSRELYPQTHPQIKEYIEKAAGIVHAGVIGFDFIIPDPSATPDGQKWGIIECNSLPFINLHHDPVEGIPIPVAKYIWEAVLDQTKK
jgi:cyanophycin synthetase